MRIPNQLGENNSGFNMTPMIDVVFLLIIFFLVTMELDKRRPLDLSTGEHGIKATEANAAQLEIDVTFEGDMFVGDEKVDLPRLREILQARVDEEGTDLEVRIRASRRVLYGKVNPIMDACVGVGIWNINYAIVRPTGG